MTETVSAGGDRKVVFLTVQGDEEDSVRNPWSATLLKAGVEEFRLNGGHDIVVAVSPDKYEPPPDGIVVIPLFDLKFGLNRFSPVRKEASGVPTWAKIFATHHCVAVSEKCVSFPGIIKSAARQITRMFSCENKNNGGDGFLWGPPPLPRLEQKRRRAWRAPQSQWRNLFWHGGK